MRNLAAKVREDIWPDFKARVQAAYHAPCHAIARDLAAGVGADYGRDQERRIAYFMDDFEAGRASAISRHPSPGDPNDCLNVCSSRRGAASRSCPMPSAREPS